jgi:hypothetical protein
MDVLHAATLGPDLVPDKSIFWTAYATEFLPPQRHGIHIGSSGSLRSMQSGIDACADTSGPAPATGDDTPGVLSAVRTAFVSENRGQTPVFSA